jgi:predicted DNA-binding transcriptional regulator YafY
VRKSDRLFQLTNILRAHQPITAKKLAERLSVSERTIYRYIDDLSLSGIPVYGESGLGYRLSAGYELPPLQLTSGELDALISGVNFITALTGKNISDSARSLLSKIEAVLPTAVSVLGREESIIRVPASRYGTLGYETWDRVHAAIASKRWLAITYEDESGNWTQRVVFPLGLFYWGGKWTMGCWCQLRHFYRDFRLDRIHKLTVLDKGEELPGHASLQHYIAMQEQMNID